MNYIYGKLSNTLQDLNNIREILLKKCEITNKPLENLKIGDYYLEISFYNSNRISYCDFSQLSEDHRYILEQLKKYIEENLVASEIEKDNINKRFDEVNNSIEKVTENLKSNVKNLEEKISNLDNKLQSEIKALENKDLELENKLKSEEQRVNNMINQLNENLTVIVNQLNKNIGDAINIINTAIKTETQLRTDSDETIIQKINSESEDLNNKILELNLKVEELFTQVSTDLEIEKNQRIQVDEQLQKNIDNEALERIKKDTNLQEQIDNINSASNENIEQLKGIINTISTNLGAEIKRSTDKDTLHDNSIISLGEQITSTKAELQANINTVDKDLQNKWNQTVETDNKLSQRIENLEGKTTRLYYGIGNQTSPNATEIQEFINNQQVEPAYEIPYSGIAVVVYLTDENTYHIWHYYTNLNSWKDDGIDTVSTFTNNTKGIIQGTVSKGYISADNGFGKVNGFIELENAVNQNNTELNNKIDSSISALNSAIEIEKQERIEAINTLSEAIGGTISGSITNLEQQLAEEVSNREEAIKDLSDTINNTITVSINSINEKLTKEISNRTTAINNLNTELSADISEEKVAREQADTTLTTNLNKEIQDRKDADTNLTNTELRFTKNIGTTVAVGGIAKGTTFSNKKLVDIINEMLYPYVAFSISGFSTSPNNGGTFEQGQVINLTNTTTSINPGSENITKAEVYDGSAKLGEKTSDFTGNSFQIPITLSVSTNKSLKVEVTDAHGTKLSRNSGGFNFVYPFYYGSLTNGVYDEASVKGLTKVVQGKGNKTFRFTHSDMCCVIAYPASYGNLRTVIDQNNFDVTSGFVQHQVLITGLDDKPVNYYVYTNSPATLDNFGLTFNF